VYPDDFRDEPALEAEAQDPRRSDGVRMDPYASDAWDDARPDGVADAALQLPAVPVDADAEKLADRGRAFLVRDALFLRDASFPLALPIVQRAEQDAVAALCTLAAVQSAEQSFAAQALTAVQQQAKPVAEVPSERLESLELRMPQSMVTLAQRALQHEPEEAVAQ
jgi:hypothetical protein